MSSTDAGDAQIAKAESRRSKQVNPRSRSTVGSVRRGLRLAAMGCAARRIAAGAALHRGGNSTH
jgi:hypothetical protein